MILRRSQRTVVPKVLWKAKEAPSIGSHTKITKKASQIVEKTASKSVTIGSVPRAVEFDKNALSVPIITTLEVKEAPSAASDPKITKKTARTAQKTALKPIVIDSLPNTIELDENDLPELPTYNPPLDLQFQSSKSLAMSISELETFQRLLTPAVIDRIVTATNSYAESAREIDEDLNEPLELYPNARPWISVTPTDIWRLIGCLLHMGYHKLANHEAH